MVTQEELGRRVAAARERAGLTQEKVANALGIARTGVTQLENGNRQVTSLELLTLSRLFEVDIRDLVEGRNPKEQLLAHFRKGSEEATDAETMAIEGVLPICRIAADLEDLILVNQPGARTAHYEAYSAAKLTGSAFSQGIHIAKLERDRLGLGFGPISDLNVMLFRAGMIVAEHDLPEAVSGVYLRPDKRPFILLQHKEKAGRRQFSLAHEYCHALLDSDEEIVVSREGDRSLRETRADAFASAFLLPREGIVQFLSAKGLTSDMLNFTHVAQLAAQYGTSYDAALVAFDQAHLLTAEQRREFETKRPNAWAYARANLQQMERSYSRMTIREWAFLRMLKAMSMDLISRRKALEIATTLGYNPDVVRQHLETYAKEES